MTILFLIFLVVFLMGAKFARKGEFFEDYISLEISNSVKGIFVIMVFFRHVVQYLSLDSILDKPFMYLNHMLGQMIVVAFLFYSGYGVYTSIQKKGLAYVKGIPFQRAFKVWFHYAVAVGIFWVANVCVGKEVPRKKILGTLVCWDAIGNSTWYIFAIVLLYLLTYFSFRFCMEHHVLAGTILTLLCVAAIMVLIPVRPGRYYNTLLCYPLGVWYGMYQEKIEKKVQVEPRYWMLLGSCFLISGVLNALRLKNVWIYELASLTFAAMGILLTMKVRFKNPVIQYAGNHVFSLFILQRLPMFVLAKTTELTERPYIFFIVTFALTIPVSWVFDWCMKHVDRVLFRK